jgi:3-isopropylmalate/(R)-2-methylmalate dehydratase small subunit
MNEYTIHSAKMVPLDRSNIDTDQIIPAKYLKRVERTGFGQYLFDAWRKMPDGTLNPDFILNDKRYEGATVLVAGANFGSGSSREHAPWALNDYGFRTILAPSFADIFRSNCFQNGMLPIALDQKIIDKIMIKDNPAIR